MRTSAEGTVDRELVLRAVGLDDPVAAAMVEAVQQEYVVRYGGRDAMTVDPAEVLPPEGLFLVAELAGRPAGCGGWRRHGRAEDGGGDSASASASVVELKRMYVDPGARRRGVAAALLAALERAAAAAGHTRVVLNSGDRQPEALALYARAGYTPVPGYGVYAGAPEAVFLGKTLPPLGAT